jgi:hypothetical protein
VKTMTNNGLEKNPQDTPYRTLGTF